MLTLVEFAVEIYLHSYISARSISVKAAEYRYNGPSSTPSTWLFAIFIV